MTVKLPLLASKILRFGGRTTKTIPKECLDLTQDIKLIALQIHIKESLFYLLKLTRVCDKAETTLSKLSIICYNKSNIW